MVTHNHSTELTTAEQYSSATCTSTRGHTTTSRMSLLAFVSYNHPKTAQLIKSPALKQLYVKSSIHGELYMARSLIYQTTYTTHA